MDRVVTNIKAFMATIGFMIGAAFPGLAGPFYALIFLLIVDYITGVIKAATTKELSSRVGSKGIVKKVFILVVVTVAGVIDVVMGLNSALTTMTLFFYIANESLSILENAVIIGVPVPKGLQDLLIQVRDKETEEELVSDKTLEDHIDWYNKEE